MLVSVIIPCYNVAAYIQECLESVYSQEYLNLEVICVDNNSSDGTLTKLRELRMASFPQMVILSESKKGASAARNCGLNMAQGEWVQFLDADDILCKKKIASQVEMLRRTEAIDFLIGSYKKRTILGVETTVIFDACCDRYMGPFVGRFGNTVSNLWRRSMLLSIGGWNECLESSQESDLMMRLVLNGARFTYHASADTIIRERSSGQISQSDPGGRWRRFIMVRVNYLNKIRDLNFKIYNERKPFFLNFLFSSILILARYDPASAFKYYSFIVREGWSAEGGFGVTRRKASLIKIVGLKPFVVYLLIRKKLRIKF